MHSETFISGKRELKGTKLEDLASDPLVTGTLAALVLLIEGKENSYPRYLSDTYTRL